MPIVDESECVRCNLCEIVCPVPGCITMEEGDNGFKPATWNEHVNEGKPLRPKKGAHEIFDSRGSKKGPVVETAGALLWLARCHLTATCAVTQVPLLLEVVARSGPLRRPSAAAASRLVALVGRHRAAASRVESNTWHSLPVAADTDYALGIRVDPNVRRLVLQLRTIL